MPTHAPDLIDDKTHTEEYHLCEGLSFPSTYAALGLCQLSQWALDFDGNLKRIIQSIQAVKRLGGFFRLGPELEVSGYSCDDHFNEFDTTAHCWQSIIQILRSDLSHNCLLDIGMPVEHKSVRYNCRVYILNEEIVLIRPKMFLANDGAYRENRWFGAWKSDSALEQFVLPKSVQRVIKQEHCPIGFAAIQCNDLIIAAESCEELFVPESPHLSMCLGGVDVFCNGSASYFEINKLKKRLDLIMAPTQKMGGIYMYCNAKGNDGGKAFFDGGSFIACNGEIVNMITPMAVNDVEVMVERINVNKVRSFRACNPSYSIQASCKPVPTIRANIWLSGVGDSSIKAIRQIESNLPNLPAVRIPNLPEEISRNIACWLWDYLRRSGAQGFFVALSGGADSTAVCVLVRMMCQYVFDAIAAKVPEVVPDLERVLHMTADSAAFPNNPADMCFQVLHTAYLGMKHSSAGTRALAKSVASELNSYHLEVDMDAIVEGQINSVASILGFRPQYHRRNANLGSVAQDLALQNVQARSRMCTSYLLAGLLPSVRATDRLKPACSLRKEPLQFPPLTDEVKRSVGFLLALSTGNLDETIRGYFTKFDCSSGDLSPIGSLSKCHISTFLTWAADYLRAPAIHKVVEATPTAELRPTTSDEEKQTDEAEMGLTYAELFMFGNMRKCERCGPVEMYELLVQRWHMSGVSVDLGEQSPVRMGADYKPAMNEEKALATFLTIPDLNPRKIAEKVKLFFKTYSENRHKSTALPPSMHAEAYDADNARHDWRPFLYPDWSRQFRQIDDLVLLAEKTESRPVAERAVPAKKILWFGGLSGGSK